MKKLLTLFTLLLSLNTLAYSHSGQGLKPTLSCVSPTYSAIEGFSFTYDYNFSIDNFMGSPLVKSNLKWDYNSLNKDVCIIPYGSKESTKVRPKNRIRRKMYPYQATLFLTVTSSSFLNNKKYFIAVDPGVLSTEDGEYSFNTPSATEWNKLIFSLSGSQTTSDRNLLENVNYLSEKEAKEFIANNLTITSSQLVNIKYNLNAVKEDYAQKERVKEWRKLVKEADDFMGWFMTEFKAQSESLTRDFYRASQMNFDESFEELTNILTNISERNLPKSFNATKEQQREFKQFQIRISNKLEEIDEELSFNYLFPDFIKDSANTSNLLIEEIMNSKKEALLTKPDEALVSQGVLTRDVTVTLDCHNQDEEIFLPKGYSLDEEREIGPFNNQGRRSASGGIQQGVYVGMIFNQSILYICKNDWNDSNLIVVGLDSKRIFDTPSPRTILYEDHITTNATALDISSKSGITYARDGYLVIAEARNQESLTVTTYDFNNGMKKESYHFNEDPLRLNLIHVNKKKILVHFNDYGTGSKIKIVDLESKKVVTIKEDDLDYRTSSRDTYHIVDSKDGKLLVHHTHAGYYFKHSLIIEDSDILLMTQEELEKVPNE